MADNAAQSIKDLDERIKSLDKGLQNTMNLSRAIAENSDMLGNVMMQALKKGSDESKEAVKNLKELNKTITDTFGNGKEIKIAIGIEKDRLKKEIADTEGRLKKFSDNTGEIKRNEKDLSEYKEQLAQLGNFEKTYARINQIVNEGKSKEGTAWSQARAARMTSEQKIINDIAREEQKLVDLEKQLARYKEGGTKWKKTKSDIEEASKQLQIYKDKLDRLQGRSVKDNTEKSIKAQMANMRQLYQLTKQYREMQANTPKSQWGRSQDLIDTRNRLREILDTMKKIEAESPGSRKIAATRLETERLRDRWREVNREIKPAKSFIESMLPTLRRLAGAFGVAFSVQGLVNFGRKLVETRGEFELQQVALRSILQNKQLADEIWDKTMQAALQSPFTAMQLTKYTKQLAAYRIETDKLFDTTKRLADVSAGLGVDMQRLILAYGQVKAANYLRASEIRQFTEAGVNILGELSTYFSKTRGEMISTAQVMDMVQKRMVTFEDVEAIFKRMTDEGGIFYNMQYVQSQTVKGQINKLHDAYDQMLNSIGKGNEGVLKDVVAALNNIVQNWRYWAAAIKSIAFGTIIASLSKLGVTLTGVNVAGIAAGKGMTKLAGGVKALGVALKGNWLTLVIGAVVSLAAELYNLNKRMKDVNAEIDEQNLNLFETKERLEGYQDAIERNNKALEGSTGNEEKLKKKREENAEILAKLKNDYPQLAEGMEMQKNGVIDLTDALKKENEELERQMTLNTLMKQSSIFDENLTKDAQDLSKAYINQQQQIIAARAQARSLMVQLKQRGAEGSNQYDILKQISEINPDDLQKAYERLIELRHLLYNDIFTLNGKQPAPGTYQPLVDYYRNYLRGISDVSDSEEDLGKEFNKLGEYVGYELEKGLEEAYKEEIEKSGLSTLQWYSLNVNKVQKDVNDGVVDIYRFLRDSLEKNGQAQGPGMQAFWNNIVKTNYIDPYFKAWKVGMEEVEAGGWSFPMALPTEGGMPNIFAAPKKGGDGSGNIITDDDGSKARKNASRLISLIREMRAEYDKLSKSAYGYAKSEDAVRKAYDKAMDEILVKAGVDKKYDFTTNEGMIAALEKVKAYADKLGPEAAAEVEKYIGQLKSEIELNVQVKVRDDFNRDLEKMFSNYELTLELQGLNIPEDMAKDLFPDLDYTTLGEIQDRMRKFYEDQRNANGEVLFDKDDLEQYRKWADKVDAEILKSRKEKAKQYSKYLEKEYSDRAKLEMQHAKDVAFVTANVSDETQRKNIITQIDKKYQDDLNELHWKSFKESSFYVEMMDDISSLPKEYMQMMLDKIEEILQHPETLSPRALKEAINARQKALEAQMNLEPLDVMRSSMKKIREAMADDSVGGQTMRQTRENIDAQIAKTQELINEKEDEARCWDETAAAMQIYENAQHEVANAYGKLDAETRKLIQNNGVLFELTARETEKNRNQQQIKENQRILDELNKKQRDGITLTESEQNQLSGLKDQNATLEARNRALESQIALLSELITKEKELATIRGQQVGTDAEKQRGEGGVGTAAEARNRAQESKAEADNLEKANQKLKAWKKSFKDFADSMEKWNASVANMINKVSAMGNAFYDTFDALGGETNALTEGWREFGNTMTQTITSALSLIPQLVTGFITAGSSINAAMGVIGLIAEAIQLVLVAVGAIAKLHDAHYEREIEIQQKKIDALQDAYARLERQIERTWDSVSYMSTYNQQIQNLNEQYRALSAQIASEEAKKNTDDEKLKGYRNQQQQILDQLDDIKQKQREVFGGVSEDSYRSVAEGFVDAWKSAFLETGDGLEALQEHFDEFLQDWFVKQGTMQAVANYYSKVWDYVNSVVKDGGLPTQAEIEQARALADEAAVQSDAFLQAIAGIFNLQGEGSLSGLAAGIQGMTEEQANILEAYWNSVRMYTASIDQHVAMIASALGVGGNSPSTNPMLQQMSLIAANTQATHQLLQSVTRSGHSLGGYGIKVFND